MNTHDIEILIEKYENAETTLKEESILKEYFQKDIVPVHLTMYKELFNYYSECSTETSTSPIMIEPRTRKLRWLSIAASIMLLVTYTYKTVDNNIQLNKDYETTTKAFQLIGSSLNKGSNIAVGGLYEYEKAQKKIFK